VLACIVVAAAAAGAGRAAPQPKLIVGVDDDTARWLARPNGLVSAERSLGLTAVRMTVQWRRGQTIPSRHQQIWLHRIALTVALGQRVVVGVFGRAAEAPIDARDQRDYCSFLAHVVRRIPIEDVVVWNEANNPAFWPRGGAAAYEELLARCWDALHTVRRTIDVIDSTAPHQDPAAFLLAVGRAFRASGRTRPIIDTYGHNVYPEHSSEPPWATHTNGSIDEGDYDRLVAVLTQAFGGTAQPLPGTGTTRIWYLEDGFQTSPPAEKRRLYSGSETDAAPVPALGGSSAESTTTVSQASQLTSAIELAYCQPDVGAFFNFELIDEHRLGGWQSGLLWTDGTAKPSADVVRQTIAAADAGAVDCASVRSAS